MQRALWTADSNLFEILYLRCKLVHDELGRCCLLQSSLWSCAEWNLGCHCWSLGSRCFYSLNGLHNKLFNFQRWAIINYLDSLDALRTISCEPPLDVLRTIGCELWQLLQQLGLRKKEWHINNLGFILGAFPGVSDEVRVERFEWFLELNLCLEFTNDRFRRRRHLNEGFQSNLSFRCTM